MHSLLSDLLPITVGGAYPCGEEGGGPHQHLGSVLCQSDAMRRNGMYVPVGGTPLEGLCWRAAGIRPGAGDCAVRKGEHAQMSYVVPVKGITQAGRNKSVSQS